MIMKENHIERFANELAEKLQPAECYFVGGFVRDTLLERESKDIDIEVYGLEQEQLEKNIRAFIERSDWKDEIWHFSLIGESFSVFKVCMPDGEIDISLPRRDTKTGTGHTGFTVEADPYMDPKDAARRRDFTMNALMKNIRTGEILDFYGGQEDLKNKILRVVDPETFTEDPLRVLRGVQFAARFELDVPQETKDAFIALIPELDTLPRERLGGEWMKLMLKSEKPSIGLNLGLELGIWDIWYPIFKRMKETPQEHMWHPEGDVWTHTMMVVDAAASIIRKADPARLDFGEISTEEKTITMFGALCHDFGKPETTEEIDGRLGSRGHDIAGIPHTRAFLEHICVGSETVSGIENIVAEHLWPTVQYKNIEKGFSVTDGAVRKLAKRLHPATIRQLVLVATADHLGRGPFMNEITGKSEYPAAYEAGAWLLERAKQLDIENEQPKPIIMARELLEIYGLKPGRHIGLIMEWIEKQRNDNGKSKEEIIKELNPIIERYKNADPKADAFDVFSDLLNN